MVSKGIAQSLLDALNQEFGWSKLQQFSTGDYPWRDEDDELFTPQPIGKFLHDEMGITLYPQQEADLLAVLGEDPKLTFEPDSGLPQQALLMWGKGCLGADERLTDYSTNETRTVKEWAAIARPLLLPSWNGHQVELRWSSPVYLKGRASLYRVTLRDRRSFVATADHKCLTPDGWAKVGSFRHGYSVLVKPPESWGRQVAPVSGNPLTILNQVLVMERRLLRPVAGGDRFIPVASVEPLGEGEFYDLTVPVTHNYLDSQGVCHSNSGKDFVVSCLMIWAMHVLLCLKDPAVYLGQAPGENIDVPIVAYSRDQATTVLLFKIKQRLKACGWFRRAIASLTDIDPDRYLKDGGGFVGAESILFPGNLRLWSLPATDAAEGKNPIIWCADEIAAFSSPVRMNQAAHIHKILRTSARTRFQDRWRGFIISYPRHKGDYLYKTYLRAIAGELPDMYAVKRATWEVNLSVTRESLEADYSNPEEARTAYECEPPQQVDAYFRSPELLLLNASGAPLEVLRAHLDGVPDEQLEAIANRGQNPIVEVDKHGDPLLDRRGFPKLARWFRGQRNRAGDEYEYYVHLDPGLSGDSFGFAMGHLHQLPDGGIQPTIDLAFRWTGQMFSEFGEIYRQAWFPDTLEQRQTVTAREVDFRTVREFLFFLRQARGFNIALVTTDNWNSVENIQELRQRDFLVSVRVVNKEDYDEFKALVYNAQLRFYGWRILIEESLKLQIINGTRVEAPRTKEGSSKSDNASKADSHKDVSDGVAAVCRRLVLMADESVEFVKLPPIESIWDAAKREGKLVKLKMSPEKASENQARLMEMFFHQDELQVFSD